MKLTETESTKVTMSWFNDKDHPLWGLIKTTLVMTGVGILLAVNATNFDSGEVKTLVGAGVMSFLLESINVKKKV